MPKKCLQKVKITAGRIFSAAAEFFGLKVLPRVGSTGHDGTEDRQSHEP
jgi:hypothetical protein